MEQDGLSQVEMCQKGTWQAAQAQKGFQNEGEQILFYKPGYQDPVTVHVLFHM